MKIENDEGTVMEMPDTLAKLLIEHHDWRKTRKSVTTPEPLDLDREVAAIESSGRDDKPIPMTHIPGVVPGISMNRLKKLVADGTIPHVLDSRTKLVKPSDVRAHLAG